jgi:hypothetical protein
MLLNLTPRPGTTDVCLNLGIGLELDESFTVGIVQRSAKQESFRKDFRGR